MLLAILAVSLWGFGCDGGGGQTTPDESDDLGTSGSEGPRVASEVPRGLNDTRWRWLEAHCTEGPLDLSSRGYAAELTVMQDDSSGAVTLITDQTFSAESCANTVVVDGAPPSSGPDWQMQEVARIAVPATPECYGRPEDLRPGTVRRAGQLLEVLVQRSRWCNGLEVRMVYAPMNDEPLGEDQIVRHYAALFTVGNAPAVASLFAETGTLLEPFTRTDTGDPYRHIGRASVEEWYSETFQSAPWRAMRITDITSAETESGAASRTMSWEYMDPRLAEPLAGSTSFTIAAGEIFEAQIELRGEPTLRPAEEPEGETQGG
ncbi:MAG: hypothetical protein AB7S26_28475 [Sandaracinaceae bacterium]